MSLTNFETKEIHSKVIYLGINGSGRSANLRSLCTQLTPEIQSGKWELGEPLDSHQFFDFLPVSLGYIEEFHVKMHLFTLPDDHLYEATRSVILKGVDGFVFIVDSGLKNLADNIALRKRCIQDLQAVGMEYADIPKVIQYNKRDNKHIFPISALQRELNPEGAAECEAVANADKGTMETLHCITKQIIEKIKFNSHR